MYLTEDNVALLYFLPGHLSKQLLEASISALTWGVYPVLVRVVKPHYLDKDGRHLLLAGCSFESDCILGRLAVQ